MSLVLTLFTYLHTPIVQNIFGTHISIHTDLLLQYSSLGKNHKLLNLANEADGPTLQFVLLAIQCDVIDLQK